MPTRTARITWPPAATTNVALSNFLNVPDRVRWPIVPAFPGVFAAPASFSAYLPAENRERVLNALAQVVARHLRQPPNETGVKHERP